MIRPSPLSLTRFFSSLIVCVGGGWLTGLVTNLGVHDWYPRLEKSALTPPNFVFPLTWTILYFFMGIALFLIRSSSQNKKKKALRFFAIQLVLNFLWSFLFFYWHKPGLALVDVVLLWIFILGNMALFFKISKLAFYLFVPYFFWVSFAMYLNFYIWTHN